jgi:hypothetical protein
MLPAEVWLAALAAAGLCRDLWCHRRRVPPAATPAGGAGITH